MVTAHYYRTGYLAWQRVLPSFISAAPTFTVSTHAVARPPTHKVIAAGQAFACALVDGLGFVEVVGIFFLAGGLCSIRHFKIPPSLRT